MLDMLWNVFLFSLGLTFLICAALAFIVFNVWMFTTENLQLWQMVLGIFIDVFVVSFVFAAFNMEW